MGFPIYILLTLFFYKYVSQFEILQMFLFIFKLIIIKDLFQSIKTE